MDNTSKNVLVILWALLVLVIVIFAPLVSIWSINTIFNLNIVYSLSTWFASFWISAITLAARTYGINK
jgi:5-bromo-4-chloroindolyl phosphate hydrolysis protein